MSSWQYFEPITTLFKKGLLCVSPLATPNKKIAMHYFCGNTVPLLPPFWTNIAKHTPITNTICGDANGVKWQ